MKADAYFSGVPGTYRELVAMLAPRQIRSSTDYECALKVVEKMIGHRLNSDQEDYMDLLATLVEQYEGAREGFKVKKMSPVEALKYIVEESGMSASDLGRLLGNRELGSKILRGERGLSMAHIGILARHFCVSRDWFMPALPESKTKKSQGNGVRWRGGKSATFRGKRQ